MALLFKLDRSQRGPDGMVTLFKGDDWSLRGQLVDYVDGSEIVEDTSRYAASGFFRGILEVRDPLFPCWPDSGPRPASLGFPAVTGAMGGLTINVPALSTAHLDECYGGSRAYVVLQDADTGRCQTVPMSDDSLRIADRGYID